MLVFVMVLFFQASDCLGGDCGMGWDVVVGGWCVGCSCVDSNIVVGMVGSVAVSGGCVGCGVYCVGGGYNQVRVIDRCCNRMRTRWKRVG